MSPLLLVKDLVLHFHTREGVVQALDGVNFYIERGEIVGLVGETGSGKTVTALSILRLLDPSARIIKGEIIFEGRDLLKLDPESMRRIRGREISIIFQEPRTSLNPILTVGLQLKEALEAHKKISSYEAHDEIITMLKKVGLPDPEQLLKRYPHELSGGMAQRVMIAMALLMKPKLLIADEPTSALDVTIQAQILELIRDLVNEIKASVLFITHDLGVAAEICDKVAVMYAGSVVECGSIYEIFEKPLHPYTSALLSAIPRPGHDLTIIAGEMPNLLNPPKGCRFYPRCPQSISICSKVKPKPIQISNEHFVSCHLYE